MALSARVKRGMRMTAADRQELAQMLYATKRQVYVDTLNELADAHQATDVIVAISRSVDRALRGEAQRNAASIADTFNAQLGNWLKDLPVEIDDAAALDAYERWLDDRNAWHAPMVSATEVYTARADATLSFYRDAGTTPAFDFLTAHSHTKNAECPVCIALIETNPHSLEECAAIGLPHQGCVHEWVARPTVVPKKLVLGRKPGGVLNSSTLVADFGESKLAAAEALRAPGGIVVPAG